MTDYTNDILATAEALVEEGRPIGIKNLETGVISDTYAVFIGYTSREVDGDLIRWTDKKALVSGLLTPKLDPDTAPDEYCIVDGGREFQIVSVNAVQPNEQLILYTIQVRR